MMIFEFIRIVDQTKPLTFVMENVRGLLSMPVIPKKHAGTSNANLTQHGSLTALIVQKFNDIGYRVDCYVVNSVNYGAPQVRERVLFIGNRHGLASNFPAPMYSNRSIDSLPPFKTLGEVIGDDFEDPCPQVLDFSPRKLKYLAMVPPGGNWRSLPIEIQKESMGKSWYLKGGRSAYWRKLSFNFPSPTVVTMPNHAGTSMCHPTKLRAITVGEAAAIQEFPPAWQFSGTVGEKFKQVGNAVPVRLGKVAGECVKDLLSRIEAGESPSAGLPNYRIIHLRPHVRTRTFWKNGEAHSGDVSYYDEDDDELSLPEQIQLAI
jgi:DNA (cytosine-5)-methyltransferase 1